MKIHALLVSKYSLATVRQEIEYQVGQKATKIPQGPRFATVSVQGMFNSGIVTNEGTVKGAFASYADGQKVMDSGMQSVVDAFNSIIAPEINSE